MRRYFLAVILLFSLCFGLVCNADSVFAEYNLKQNEIIMNQSTRNIDLIDPQKGSSNVNNNFPGYRGANQLVVYTPAYGVRTNTNEFGAEAIVVDGIVTEISGADSLIPQNGIVISGHGSAKNWINKNLIVGTKISVNRDNQTITAYTTTDSYIIGAQSQLKEVKYIAQQYVLSSKSYNSKKTDYYIRQAENYIEKAKRNKSDVQKYSELAIQASNTALASAIPYKQDELRGVWIRPTLKSREEICGVLDRISQAGLNTIFIETFYHGMTIFPSNTMESRGFTKVNPAYENFDNLDFWIYEAHKRNIKVHIWFETFYVGNKKPESNPKSILAVCPSWANIIKRDYEKNKPTASVAEHNGYFLDPANPEVQNFLLELICEIIQRYKPDGINVDYIRYPQALPPQAPGSEMASWGYTKFAREDFQAIYGVDPVDLTIFDPLWESWNEYRRDKVTDFVYRVSKICRSNKTAITTVIFPNRQAALNLKQQDWKRWSTNNYVDGFTPLFLTCDPTTASGLMQEVIRYKQPNTKLYAGLFITFMNGSESDLIKQINQVRMLGLSGFSIFDYAHFTDKYVKPLTISICSIPTASEQKKNDCTTNTQKNKTVNKTKGLWSDYGRK